MIDQKSYELHKKMMEIQCVSLMSRYEWSEMQYYKYRLTDGKLIPAQRQICNEKIAEIVAKIIADAQNAAPEDN